jgi:hypothetical protein
MPRYDRLLLSLDDTELEEFVRQWVVRISQYVEVERFTGTGDMGRDVVVISVFLTGPVRRFVLAHPLNDRVL